MNKKKKLLLINKVPFGNLVDSLKWCTYLRKDYDITVLCFESSNHEHTLLDGIKLKYVSYRGAKFIRGLRYILTCLWNIFLFRGLIMVVYFEHCEIFKQIFYNKKMLLDIRTLAVCGTQDERDAYDENIRRACERYDVVTLISNGVQERLHLRNPNVYILPLGSDVISIHPKDYSKLRLLYVGTLSGRNIDKTIEGLYMFLQKNHDVEIYYDIVGDGFNNELSLCREMVEKLELSNNVKLHGYVSHDKLSSFFDQATIGISFVPMTSFYDNQPVTKTYEYANSGLFVIGTETVENKKVIHNQNGILIKDTPEDFARAIEYIYLNSQIINEDVVRTSLIDNTWGNIVKNKLVPILNSLK